MLHEVGWKGHRLKEGSAPKLMEENERHIHGVSEEAEWEGATDESGCEAKLRPTAVSPLDETNSYDYQN